MLRILFTLAALPLAAQVKVPENLIHDADVVYSRVGGQMAMDIVRPRDSAAHPTVVAIHGGGFRAGKRESYLPLCIKLAQRGYTCATVTYRLSPRNQFPAPVEDVKAAVRFLRANAAKYTVDPDLIGTTGGSAGGHLALFLGLTQGVAEFEGTGGNQQFSSSVKCVVSYYGPTDFTKSYGKSVDAAEVLPMFLGGDLEHARNAHLKASPLYWVSPASAPVLAVHGTVDRYVEYNQSVWLVDKLKSVGVDAELETIEGSDHGFKGKDAERAEALLMKYFDKHLKPAPERNLLISDHGPNGEIVSMMWPSGKILWRTPNKRGHDVQPLPGGHVLFTMGADHKVVEIDQNQKQVWQCCDGLDHPLSAQRLANGNTLIGDAKSGKVIEVDAKGAVVWKYESPDIANMRMRNSRRTPEGTTLIAVEVDAKLIEVDRGGNIVWSWQAPGTTKRPLYQGQRLANGNTLMSLADPGEIVEVDKSGRIVRSVGGDKPDIRFGWASGLAVLPDGGLIVNDYTGRRIIEVDKQGKLLHEWRTGSRTVASIALVN